MNSVGIQVTAKEEERLPQQTGQKEREQPLFYTSKKWNFSNEMNCKWIFPRACKQDQPS